MDWNKFKEFLHSLGVEMESRDAVVPPEEPMITLLQRSHHHEAFYRIDFFTTGPELLVLLPTNQTPLKFHFYRVQWSEAHPLGRVLTRLMQYQGSDGFEQKRDVVEWQLLHAITEIMKALFWVGQETSHVPPEISIQKIG